MQVALEIVQELHVECVRALRWYIAEANKTCRILAEITRFPVSLEVRNQILQQRRAENAAHDRRRAFRKKYARARCSGARSIKPYLLEARFVVCLPLWGCVQGRKPSGSCRVSMLIAA